MARSIYLFRLFDRNAEQKTAKLSKHCVHLDQLLAQGVHLDKDAWFGLIAGEAENATVYVFEQFEYTPEDEAGSPVERHGFPLFHFQWATWKRLAGYPIDFIPSQLFKAKVPKILR